MSNNNSQENKISTAYEQAINNRDMEAVESELFTIVSQFKHFGKEAVAYLNRKLKNAEKEELEKLFLIIPEYDQPELSQGLEYIVTERIVPLDIKLKVFEVMSQLGYSLDDTFLQQLHNAEQLYVQLSSYFKSADDDDIARALSLKEEFFALPQSLKRSIIMEIESEWGDKATGFLVNLVGDDQKTDEEIIEILARSGDQAAANSLQRVIDTTENKATAKLAKRALYVLKEKGVTPELEQEEKIDTNTTLSIQDGEEQEQAFVSTFDSFGSRILLLVKPVMSRLLVCQASVDEKKGMTHFTAAEMPKKKFREFLKDLKERISKHAHSRMGEIDATHCRWLMEESYRLTQKAGHLIPTEYKTIRYRIKLDEAYDPREFYKSELEIDKSQKMLFDHNADDIFALEEVGIWIIEKEQLFPFVKRYIDLADSKLIVNEEQRQEQLDAAAEKYAREYFSDSRIVQIIHRLWETALVLKGLNRAEDSGSVAALAASIKDHADLTLHSFFKSFMIRSIIGTIQALSSQYGRAAQDVDDDDQNESESGIIT